MEQSVFEIVSVGNELLIGRVENTNAYWLISQIFRMGGFVRRAVTIRDDLEEISTVLRDSLTRRTEWIIISGGLGPTYDDMTLQGVALALGRELAINQEAVAMIKDRYRRMVEEGLIQEVELTPARLKMAMLPKGAIPLRNSAGTAPGVLIQEGHTFIVCLPGVPKELKTIFEESLTPMLRKSVTPLYSYSISLSTRGVFESVLSPLLDKTLNVNPGVYVKSHPRGVEEGISRIEIHVMCTSRSQVEAKEKAVAAAQMLASQVEESKGAVEKVDEGYA